MERLEFLEKAREIACEQVSDSSCLTEAEFKRIIDSDDSQEVELYRMAKHMLEDASYDMENTIDEIVELAGEKNEN